MDQNLWRALPAALMLAAVHVAAPKLRFLAVVPRSRWLSFAGGVSVAYVFVHLLPELAEMEETLMGMMGGRGPGRYVYLVALAGLAIYYGLERLAKRTHGRGRPMRPGQEPDGVFWVHIASFSMYNLLVGYLLTERKGQGEAQLALFATAMALHFLVNDFGLQEHYREVYRRRGRWILAVSVVLGWALGALGELHEALIAGLLALLAGGIVLNVLKEELPEERESRFWAFALGMAGYAALLLAA